ncbi:MAG TPA: cyclic nucleotide-binding domain-containing protein [Acidimicrobiales bacterium]|jgi:CRP-like cAMP-binding protein
MFIRHNAVADDLAQVTLFGGCTRKELRELASISTGVDIHAGQVMCQEGHVGSEFFVVAAGHATVTIAGDCVATIGPGEFFGEMALLDGGRRGATVTATTDMHVLVMSRHEFVILLADVPRVSRRMLEALSSRLRTADMQLRAHQVGV